MNLETILGNLAMIADNGPCRSHASLESDAAPKPFGLLGGTDMLFREVAERDPRDVMYMLLGLILDLWRRNEYMYLTLKDHVAHADPELTAMIATHSDILGSYEPERRWKDRAQFASTLVHRLLEDTQPHHHKYLEEVGRPVRRRVEERERTRLGAPPDDHSHG